MSKRVLSSVLIIAVVLGLAAAGWALAHRQAVSPHRQQEALSRLSTGTERAQTLKSAERDRIIEWLKADISALASAPRYSTEEYQRAMDYVIKRAKEAGLEVEVESVDGIPQWKRGDKDQCELLLPDGSRIPLDMVALTGSVAGDVEGEVVLVSDFKKGWKPPARRFDEGGKLRIIYFSRRLQQDHTINGYSDTVYQRNHGASKAAESGAKAVLVRSVQTGDGPPHTGAVAYVKGLEIPAVALSVEAADRLEQELQKHGKVKVHLKINSTQAARQQSNVVIRIPGTSRAKEIVLLSAHLDSHDVTPGAADDAAGVAAVLSVMREFAKNRPARTILLVLFADEELKGSGNEAFAKSHKQELANIVAAMEVDDGDGAPYALQITSSASEAEAAKLMLRKIAEGFGDEAKGLEILTSQEANGTDLEKLWADHGIPEIAILQNLRTYFDRHHAKNDTPGNINWDGLERTTHLLSRIMQVLTSGEVTPLRGATKLPRPAE